jgi:hypothetical protein
MNKKHLEQAKQISKTLKSFAKLLDDARFVAAVDILISKDKESAGVDINEFFKSKGVKLPLYLQANFRKRRNDFFLCSGKTDGCKVCLRHTSGRGWWWDSVCD